MKSSKPILLVLAGMAVVCSVVLSACHRYTVSAKFTNDGLQSLKSNGFDFIQSGNFVVHDVVLRSPNGETHAGSTEGGSRFDAQRQELSRFFPWGDVKITYTSFQNRLNLTIATTNTSASDTIQSLWYQPMTLKLPAKAKEYDGSIPMLFTNLGQVAVSRLTFGSGSLAVVSEDVKKPVLIGFPWADNRPDNTIFPLSVSTGRVKSYPDSIPVINRPIAPKATDEFRLSIRLGSASEPQTELAADTYKKFGESFGSMLNWTDRRPIGAIFLSSPEGGAENNPRGWFNDRALNVNAPSGCADFRKKVMNLADTSVAVMKEMNAQGAITWDLEGEEYPHAGYVGDPRMLSKLAPEMAGLADDYFARIRNAGLRVGICVRPQQLQVSADKKTATQVAVADPAQLLIDKIAYAKHRWGVSIAYIDSNSNASDSTPMDVAVLAKVNAALPDVLLVPQYSNLSYYAYSAPYKELRQGFTGTPQTVRDTYPKAFSLIYTVDGLMDFYHKDLAKAVKSGDVLVYRTSWRDPQNEKVKGLIR